MGREIGLVEWLQRGGDFADLIGRQCRFPRSNGKTGTARIEALSSDGKRITIRYNGVQEWEWSMPFAIEAEKLVLSLEADGLPPRYDARPLTQR